jgi:hypothetical protein
MVLRSGGRQAPNSLEIVRLPPWLQTKSCCSRIVFSGNYAEVAKLRHLSPTPNTVDVFQDGVAVNSEAIFDEIGKGR